MSRVVGDLCVNGVFDVILVITEAPKQGGPINPKAIIFISVVPFLSIFDQ